MKIAVVGTGISGMVAAHLLCGENDVHVFEAAGRLGGHTHTIPVQWDGHTYPVDTGFIVFNDWTYPSFIALLERLGVASQPTTMSFSVRCENSGLEYNGENLNTIFAQRRNLLRPGFHRMLRDIMRFNREAPGLLEQASDTRTLGEYLADCRYSQQFVDHYIVPMGAAIWSAAPESFQRVPARFFVRFFYNHGMLSVNDRPQWRVVRGGSCRYIERLTAPYQDRIRLNSPVRSVRRYLDRVEIQAVGQPAEAFDRVIIATHSDQALAMLADPSDAEIAALGSIPYQENEAVLHTDDALMPRNRRCWASWNYHIVDDPVGRVALTYNMNILQGLEAPVQFCVTLNRSADIDPQKILRRITYHHPVFTSATVQAQKLQEHINGSRRTYYCGAYWGNGFHEDGVNSALAVCRRFGARLAA